MIYRGENSVYKEKMWDGFVLLSVIFFLLLGVVCLN